MKLIIKSGCFLFSILWVCLYQAQAQAQGQANSKENKITVAQLLKELPDRENLARYPEGTWTLHHASSYDRHSVEKDKEGWYANDDWDNYIRKETNNGRDEYVLMDADGPGVITRFWVAGHPNQKANLRFYIDGQSTPFWEADHTGALIGQNKSIGAPLSERSVDEDFLPINKGAQPGHNLYAPIPFSKHLKVTYEHPPGGAGSGFWYNIDYRIYQPGTLMESFSKQAAVKYAKELALTNKVLKTFMLQAPLKARVPGEIKHQLINFSLSPGSSTSLEITGASAIKRIVCSLHAANLDSAVKNTWLQIEFDGRVLVDVPCGFFFGCGDQYIQTKDWFAKIDSLGNMAAYWVMPFQQKAIIRLINKGNEKISGSLTAARGNWKWSKNSMYFHADYKRMDNFSTQAKIGQDFNYLDLQSTKGVYVGDLLQVNKAIGGWWGEGDEKIYIDGSTFPDDFGTGSEDYYGYAWGHPEIFTHVFIAQPIGNANLSDRGGTTVDTRKRGLDAIPFQKSFHFDMESWNWHGGPVNFAWTCFWYEKNDAP